MRKKTDAFIKKTLHVLEFIIAVLTLIVLIFMMGLEVYNMFTVKDYFSTSDNYLQNILTIVVGLEFVRMLINMTPANTLDVLIVAISRQVIVNHIDTVSNIVCVVCIAGLFAIRRFLIPKDEINEELTDR